MKNREKLLLLILCFVAVFCVAAQTAINLSTQVTGILPLSETSLTVTSPIVLATPNISCPTCSTGPNTTIIGGIIGGNANGTAFAASRLQAFG